MGIWSRQSGHGRQLAKKTGGTFLWDYSGYSYSALEIAEYTEFQFPKEPSLIHSENGILMAEVTWELLRLPTASKATDTSNFPYILLNEIQTLFSQLAKQSSRQ